jgi:tetratricopeptide (TPR) repeat protein
MASPQTVPAVVLAALLAAGATPAPGGRSTRELLRAGILAIEESNFPRAAARFREAAQIDPRLAQAHLGLGLAALGERDRKGAERELREADLLSRGAPEVRYALGITRFVFNDLRLAEEDLKAAAGDRFFLEARYALGIVTAVRGDLQGAQAALQEALRLDGRNAASRYQLGAVLARSGDLDGALNELGKALSIDPDIMDARPEDPIEFATRPVRSSSPGSAGLGMPIAVLRPSVAWPRRAAAGGTAPARDIPDWFLYYQMALYLEDASQWRGAVDMLERALSIKDRSELQAPVADRLVDYSPHLHLAEAYHRQGNFREAFLHLGIAKNEGNVPPDALRALEVLIQKDRLRPVILLETLPDRTTEETVRIRGVIISEETVPRVEVGSRDAILRPATTAEVSALLPDRDHPAPKEAVQSTHFEVPAYRLPAIGPNLIRIRPTFRNPARQGDLIEVRVVRLPRAAKPPAAAPSRGAP